MEFISVWPSGIVFAAAFTEGNTSCRARLGWHRWSTHGLPGELRTLDSVLEESGLQRIDFLSLDVEEMELDVLAGFDLTKWKPKLILIEDFLYDGCKRTYLRRRGYKLVRRTGYNNWHVPRESAATSSSAN